VNFLSDHFLIFLPVALLLWYATRGYERLRVVLMIAASLVFYADHYWWFVPIILAYCLADWMVGLALAKRPRRAVLAAGIAFNLGVLCVWKYTPLLLTTLAALVGFPSEIVVRSVAAGWILPLGVSFYSFSGIAYMVDVYRRRTTAEPDLLRYTLFTVFFPHLVAGPILRASEFLAHLAKGRLPRQPDNLLEGFALIARGSFRKAVLGDGIAVAVDPYFAHAGDPTTAGVWALPYLYLYALQIYFDFAGYTDIARGLGLWFGFRWPENFDRPYLSASIQEFWRRWHMTLSRFLRDYLYIPLGGNQHGRIRQVAALMITMTLGGLWHGASWSFMLWGALHGLLLVAHLAWTRLQPAQWLAAHGGLAWRAASIAVTFHVVCLAWAFFRIANASAALACLKGVFVFDPHLALAGGSADPSLWLLIAAYSAAALALRHMLASPGPEKLAALPVPTGFRSGLLWGGSLGLGLLAWLLAPSAEVPPFIYFQF
jgi:alginate O-acetyltransferase complex protein AlgI